MRESASSLLPSSFGLLQQRPVGARLVEGGEEPVVELERHALRAALDFVFLRVIGEVAAGVVERFANAFVAGQFLVELAEQRPRGVDEHRVGHRQHGRDAGGGQARGHAAHRAFGPAVFLAPRLATAADWQAERMTRATLCRWRLAPSFSAETKSDWPSGFSKRR